MNIPAEFDKIRPYTPEELPKIYEELIADPSFRAVMDARYDAILDTQGLIKSGLISSQAKGHRYGFASEVARESLAARFYDETFIIPPNAHAVE